MRKMLAVVLAMVSALAVPARAQARSECAVPDRPEVCELESFTDLFLGLQVGVTGPDEPPVGAVAEFVTAVLGALSSREQAIIAELNALRVADATAALRTAIGSRNMLLSPDPRIRRDFVARAAEAAYLAESLVTVSAGDPETVGELGRVGMAAYALYLTGTIATGEDLPRPDADEGIVLVMGEFIRLLELLLDILLEGGTADEVSDVKDELEEARERIRNREPGDGGEPQVLEHVALGDSYASGTGTGHYTAGGPRECYRSHLAYPGLLNGAFTMAGEPLRTVNKACHGAVFFDVYDTQEQRPGIEGPQIMHLSNVTTRLVTISVSGNDLYFGKIVRDCLYNPAGFCGVGEGNPLARPDQLDGLRDSLRHLYLAILGRIRPDGQVVVLTYPNIAPAGFANDNPCWVTDKLVSRAELAMIADLVLDVRVMIETAVAAVGNPRVQVVDMSDAFEGHQICETDSWATSLTWPLGTSFHPNAAGHREYARRIARAAGLIAPGLAGAAVSGPAARPARTAPGSAIPGGR